MNAFPAMVAVTFPLLTQLNAEEKREKRLLYNVVVSI